MTIGKASDFVIYQPQFHTGFTEVLTQESNVFNQNSNGAITLITQGLKGDFEQRAFYQLVDDIVTRRNTASTSAVADKPLTQEEDVFVKLARRFQLAQTLDSFRKIGSDPREMSFVVGQQVGKAVMVDYLNTSIAAADVAFAKTYAVDASASTMNHSVLVKGMSQFGDAGQNVIAFVMHSKPFYDLMQQSIADKIFEVAGVTIHTGTVASLNRPIIVSDVPGLVDDSGSVTKYHTLALTRNAVNIKETEGREVVSRIVDGHENLFMRIQGEHSFNIGFKGYKWNIAAGINPADSALTNAANWLKNVSEDKMTGGVRLITQ
jgi:hypothetical protein